jgi:hypothetical protein
MMNDKKIMLSAALAILTAPYAFALDLPALYKEASALWSAEQAVRLPSALTTGTLTAISNNYGAAAGKELALKKEMVSALVNRFKTCELNAEDLSTAEKYLNNEFRSEVAYFADYGCKAVNESPGGIIAAKPARSASLGRLQAYSASMGEGGSYAGFFDGSKNNGAVLTAGAAGPEARLETRELVKSPQPVSTMSSLNSKAGIVKPVPAPMSDINDSGRVHKAVNYWIAMRDRNWAKVKFGDQADKKAKAAAAAAVAFGLAALLVITNLPRVEKAAAKLGWDSSQGAQGIVIAADAAKLGFHIGAVVLVFIPIFTVAKAALAGSPWAISLVAAMTIIPINNYLIHLVD